MAVLTTSFLTLALALVAGAASAQGTVGTRWEPWLGCWHVHLERVPGAPREDARVCVAAAGDAATVTTTVGDRLVLNQQLVADGAPHPFADGACTGTQRIEWSGDGHRLYSQAELTCPGGVRRSVGGLSLLGPDGAWIDTQAMTIGQTSSVRVRRLVRSGGESPQQPPAARRLTLDDVTDAARRVPPAALEAAIVETRATFALTAPRLVALDEAGVPGSVIDVMVALTFPQAFSLRPAARADRLTPFPFEVDAADPSYSWWPATMGGAGAYFNSAYFMSPFGYSFFGAYPAVFGIDALAAGGATRDRPTRGGRVVDGQGYTRQAPRRATVSGSDESPAASTREGSTGTVSTRGYSRGGDSSSSGSGATSSSGTGGAAGSSGSSDGGRTAVPR